MRPRSVLSVVCAVVTAGALVLAQTAKPRGAATPQEAVATAKKAVSSNDPLLILPVVSPNFLKSLASETITSLLMVLALSDPNDPVLGPKPTAAELATKKKNYNDALAVARTTLKPHKLDGFVGDKPMATGSKQTLDAALESTDNLALVADLYGAMMKMGPLLGMKESSTPTPPPLVDLGSVTAYKVTGDHATAQNGAETIDFTRINGRWFLEAPSTGASAPTSSSSTPGGSQGAATAPRAAAAGKDPEVVAGGLRVARVAVADDDYSAKPFHADNGTTVVLWVKMPAGSGLIEIDEDASTLQTFTDDKGTTLSAKFGSFPQEFKDGSGGTIEIESKAFPAPGASALLAEGSVALTLASGTRKTRVANVALRNDATLTLGTTKMTVSEVETQSDAQTFTIKLPRTVMMGVKNVVFLDARGQAVEGRRTASGYMNEAGEVSFSVKTQAKTLTMEFEQWQGLRTIKVPFKIRATLGLQ